MASARRRALAVAVGFGGGGVRSIATFGAGGSGSFARIATDGDQHDRRQLGTELG